MGKTTKTTAEKLQEVIMAKTMNSIAGVPETKSTKKETEKAPKATKVETSKKEEKETKKTKKVSSTPREVKYTYPEGCNSSLEKKKFRADFRAKVKRFEADLSKAKEGTKEYKKVFKEYQEYKARYIKG